MTGETADDVRLLRKKPDRTSARDRHSDHVHGPRPPRSIVIGPAMQGRTCADAGCGITAPCVPADFAEREARRNGQCAFGTM